MTREEAIYWIENLSGNWDGKYREARDMAFDALRAQQEQSWISVKDRLPVTGNVLTTDGQIIITAPSSSVRNRKSITHWMPLPEPPKEGADNDQTETR